MGEPVPVMVIVVGMAFSHVDLADVWRWITLDAETKQVLVALGSALCQDAEVSAR